MKEKCFFETWKGRMNYMSRVIPTGEDGLGPSVSGSEAEGLHVVDVVDLRAPCASWALGPADEPSATNPGPPSHYHEFLSPHPPPLCFLSLQITTRPTISSTSSPSRITRYAPSSPPLPHSWDLVRHLKRISSTGEPWHDTLIWKGLIRMQPSDD
ncbi:hypothetical protein HPP92_004949 [Vanilla planifolia]|uniref:Uncharacterized protein n=1 Tax=Vanilla planifolia TaxID=51239 RepID=A0A835RKG3_VANPL|nr:hypothetical protein HPP92_004949 [Vanilla planifolia]